MNVWRFIVRHPIVKEIAYAFDLQPADDKSARMIFPVRLRLSVVIVSVPHGFERVTTGGEFRNSILPMKHAYQLAFGVIDPEADRPLERRKRETQRDRFGGRGGLRGDW